MLYRLVSRMGKKLEFFIGGDVTDNGSSANSGICPTCEPMLTSKNPTEPQLTVYMTKQSSHAV